MSYLLYFLGMYLGLPYAVHGIAFFVLVAVIGLIKQGVQPWQSIPKLVFLPLLYFLVLVISFSYTQNTPQAFFLLQLQFTFLVLPFLFAFERPSNQLDIYFVIQSFVAVSLAVGFAMIAKSIFIFFTQGTINYYTTFSVLMHPSYLAIYFNSSVLFSVWLIINSRKLNWIAVFSILISFAGIYFSGSKAGLISVFLLLLFMMFRFMIRYYKRLTFIVLPVVLLIFVVIIMSSGRFSNLFKAVNNYQQVFEHPVAVEESTALRLLTWHASSIVIAEHPIFGVGLGDNTDQLCKVYAAKNYKMPLDKKMNSHNQFLETTVGQGIIGLSALLVMLLLPLFHNSKNQFLIHGFLIIFITNMLFESIFTHQAGVVFYAFFMSFLLTHATNDKTKPNKLWI